MLGLYRRVLFFSVLFLFSGYVSAVWTGPVTVEWVRSYAGDDTLSYDKLSDSSVWEGCTNSRDGRVYLLKGDKDRAFSVILTAIASKLPVRADVRGYEVCTNNTALISEIQIGN